MINKLGMMATAKVKETESISIEQKDITDKSSYRSSSTTKKPSGTISKEDLRFRIPLHLD